MHSCCKPVDGTLTRGDCPAAKERRQAADREEKLQWIAALFDHHELQAQLASSARLWVAHVSSRMRCWLSVWTPLGSLATEALVMT